MLGICAIHTQLAVGINRTEQATDWRACIVALDSITGCVSTGMNYSWRNSEILVSTESLSNLNLIGCSQVV